MAEWKALTSRRSMAGPLPPVVMDGKHLVATVDGGEQLYTPDGNDRDPNAEEARDNARAQLFAAAPDLLAALKLNWEHTDDSGRTFYCNCPRMKKLMCDASDDPDERHATSCREARAAIAKAEGR